MKADIHPNYHMITVVMTDRHRIPDAFHLGQGRRQAQSRHRLQAHPAWIGGAQQILDRGGRVSRFQKKFSGFLRKD